MSEQYIPKYDLQTYSRIFGGVFEQLLSTSGTDDKDVMKELTSTSEYFLQAVQSLDELIERKLGCTNMIDHTTRSYISSPLLDTLNNYNKSPMIVLSSNGFLEQLKYLYHNKMIDISVDGPEISFIEACENGHLDIAKWLRSEFQMKFTISTESIFTRICCSGHLDIVVWFYENYCIGEINDPSLVFRQTCYSNELEVAKWVLKNFPCIDIRKNNEAILSSLFTIDNNLDLKKWLFSVQPDLRISEHEFLTSCQYNNIETVKWILSTFSHINLRYYVRYYDMPIYSCTEDDSLELLTILSEYYTEEDEHILKKVLDISRCNKAYKIIAFLVQKFPCLRKIISDERDMLSSTLR